MTDVLTTDRLTLRPWRMDDAEAALRIFGDDEAARWLNPAMHQVSDLGAMSLLLQQWILEDARAPAPAGRWAIELSAEARVVGGVALLYLPPGGEDLEIGVQLAPDVWGRGLASEAGHRVAHYGLAHDGVEEVFAVVRPTNTRAAAMARRIGMEWVGETDKYYDLRLHVYRLQSADLDRPLPGQLRDGGRMTGDAESALEVVDVPDRHRYEIVRDGTVLGYAAYQKTDQLIVFTHTEVDPSLEGRGVGSLLVRGALDHVRTLGLAVLPVCPFVQAWLARHRDYADLDYRRPNSHVTD